MVEILGRRAPTWLRHIAPRPSPVRPHGGDSVEQDAARTSERLMRELTTFLEESSAEKPLVLVVEDLHWTDISTVDVLVHLAARLSRLRLLIIITYRHHELGVARSSVHAGPRGVDGAGAARGIGGQSSDSGGGSGGTSGRYSKARRSRRTCPPWYSRRPKEIRCSWRISSGTCESAVPASGKGARCSTYQTHCAR